MRIAVLSGKGGTGKTMVSVNLACAAKNASYIDCDVEEPNGRLFLKPEGLREEIVCKTLPQFDEDKCCGCRKCVDFCRFNALAYLRKKHKVFEEMCHSCGGCQMVCPNGAVSETRRPVGKVEIGRHGSVHCFTGELNPGEASGIPVISTALKLGCADSKQTTIIDCPPGSSCSVMESISGSDFCLLVAEPTAFGLHNLAMVCQLVTLLGKKCGVVINKETAPFPPMEDYLRAQGIPILTRIPYDARYAALGAEGEILCERDRSALQIFENLLAQMGGACS